MKAIKLLLIAITTLLFTSCAMSQLAIITPTTQNVTVAWEHSGLDSLGNTETMLHYKVWLRHNLGAVICVGVSDTLQYAIILPDTVGEYVIGVSAVDMANNESSIHFSTDSTAGLGGWYLLFDLIAPAVPFGLMRIK